MTSDCIDLVTTLKSQPTWMHTGGRKNKRPYTSNTTSPSPFHSLTCVLIDRQDRTENEIKCRLLLLVSFGLSPFAAPMSLAIIFFLTLQRIIAPDKHRPRIQCLRLFAAMVTFFFSTPNFASFQTSEHFSPVCYA